MKKPVMLGAALGAALLAGGAASYTSTTPVRAATLSSLVLTKNDVPAGYKQTTAQVRNIQSAASADGTSASTLRARGWISEYESAFTKGSGANVRNINSSVTQFKSAQGAAWDLNNGEQLTKKEFPKGTLFKVSGIGQSPAGIRITAKSGGISFTVVLVAFREGSYVGAVGVTAGGKAATPSASEVEALARTVDGRLKHA